MYTSASFLRTPPYITYLGSVRKRLRVAAYVVSTCDSAWAMAAEMAARWWEKKDCGDVRDVP